MKTVNELANMFDHTLLKPDVSKEDFKILCRDANNYGFKMVAINSAATQTCKAFLKDSSVNVGAAIGFPLGQTTLEAKVFETTDAIEKGADEIDYVINIVELKNKNYEYIQKEMAAIVTICRENNVCSKVIFETCYLTKEEIIKLSEIALQVKPDFVKTSTGFGTEGATIENVRLMKSVVGNSIKVKASGGIKDLETCLAMIEAGAERIGTSSSIKILEDYKIFLEKN
ncbi:MAG: deoxyribose-phosphate aldolase [Eubacteriaceae bacterium]